MSEGALALAFSAGALAAFNPCGFALLPGWAAYLVAGGDRRDDLLERLLRALRAGGIATAAFLVVFGLAGVIVTAGFLALGDYLPWLGLAIGAVLAALGALLLVRGHAPGLRLSRQARRGTDIAAVFGFGLAYALTSLSCVLPVFLLMLGIAAGEPPSARVLGFIGFALGMGTVLTLVAIAAALAREGVLSAGRIARVVPRLAGAVVLAASVLVVQQEIRLAALALGEAGPSSPTRFALALAAVAIVATGTLAVVSARSRHGGTPAARLQTLRLR
ncbi:MAG: cytochrome c biogenesis CcdA family protein [Gaiellaceae bacterium]